MNIYFINKRTFDVNVT